MVGAWEVESQTNWLKANCSTIELHPQIIYLIIQL